MKTTKLFKVGALAMAILTMFVGCGGPKNDKAAQDAVHTAMVNSSKVKSENYDLLLSGKITTGKDSQVQFKELVGTLDFAGVFDMKTKDDPKFTLKIDAKGTIDGGKEQSIAGEMLLANKNFYFTVGKLNIEAVPELYKTAIDQFMNKWWSVELPPESFSKLTAGAADDKDLTPEQKQIKDLLEKTQFFKNVSDLGADKVGEVAAEKYSVELDKEAFKNYLTEAAKISGQDSQQPDAAQIDKFMALVEFKGNVWVSKDDQMLRKIDGTVKVAPGTETDNSTITLQATYTVDNLNKDVKVDAPAKSEKFDISKFLGAAAPAIPEVK
jgi:hypothetical protein